MPRKTQRDKASDNYDKYLHYRAYAEDFMTGCEEDEETYFGSHWSSEEKAELKARGQPEITINRSRPIIRQMAAMVTANNPTFRSFPVEDVDNDISTPLNDALAWLWNENKGKRHLRRAAMKMLRKRQGWLMWDFDPDEDEGRGRIRLLDLDPTMVFVDNTAMPPFYSNAESIILTKELSYDKAANIYPDKAKELSRITTMGELNSRTDLENKNRIKLGSTDISEPIAGRGEKLERVLLLETYAKEKVSRWRMQVSDDTGTMIEELVVDNKKDIDDFKIKYPEIKVEIAKFRKTVIKVLLTAGQDVFLDEYYLDDKIMEYPMVPFMVEETDNPYPAGEMTFLRDFNRLLDKFVSITVHNAQIGSNIKLMAEENTIPGEEHALREWLDNYAKPGGVSFWKNRKPEQVMPAPLNSAFFTLAKDIEKEMEYSSGMWSFMRGDPEGAPETARGTLLLSELGAEKAKLITSNIDDSLSQLGKVALMMIQTHWNYPMWKRFYNDDTSKVEQLEFNTNDNNALAIGKYDVVVGSGSTLPTNRMAILQLMMELFGMNLVLPKHVRKYLDLPNMNEIEQEMDEIGKLQGELEQRQQAIDQMQKEISRLSGMVKTMDRTVNDEQHEARQKVELARFKAEMEVLKGEYAQQTEAYLDKLKLVMQEVKSSKQQQGELNGK